MTARDLTPIDRFLADTQRALDTVFGAPGAIRANPAADIAQIELDEAERQHAAGLMRINHVGEVCAQALYCGQAAVARDEVTRQHLLEAAQEETDHLAWCADRLRASAAGSESRCSSICASTWRSVSTTKPRFQPSPRSPASRPIA